jgi:branched-chain amino acid transport system substrate-binding protein
MQDFDMQQSDSIFLPWECSGEPPQWKEHSLVINRGLTCFVCGRPHPHLEVPQHFEIRVVQPLKLAEASQPISDIAETSQHSAITLASHSKAIEVSQSTSSIELSHSDVKAPQPAGLTASRPIQLSLSRLFLSFPPSLRKGLLTFLLFTAVGGVSGFVLSRIFSPDRANVTATRAVPISPSTSITPAPLTGITDMSERFSSGERRLLRYLSNSDADRGVKAFAAGDYRKAEEFLAKAIEGERHNPEIQIYYNNAQARLSQFPPLKVAVVVPIEAALTSAEEVLRGAADAQTKFNEAGGAEGRLLEIVIANDDNDLEIASQVAKTLAADSQILGVVGHPTSATSEVALVEYEKANLPMISATSDSTFLSGKVFFRTISSVQVSNTSLAEYTRNSLNLRRIAVFYNPNDVYSESSKEVFTKGFMAMDGQKIELIDMSRSDFQPDEQIEALQGQFDAIALFPDPRLITVAYSIAAENNKLPEQQRMQLLGGNSLYRPQTLTIGGNAVEDLILAVPWVAKTPYAEAANQRWGGQVSWRTAMSYDATLAFTAAASKESSRASILANLRTIRISSSQTSGDLLQFSETGERIGKSVLVQVARGDGGPDGAKYTFKPID